MTPNPISVDTRTSATDALNKMLQGNFRHLPVVNTEAVHEGESSIVGVLDITKCLAEALDKLDRAYESSKKLCDALEGVEKEFSPSQNSHSAHLKNYATLFKEKVSMPELTTVLSKHDQLPPEVSVKCTVRDAARTMKAHRQMAVLAFDNNSLAGILTTKDVVLRVIAAGLGPETTSVVRIMTPHPDSIQSSETVLDALRKMYSA